MFKTMVSTMAMVMFVGSMASAQSLCSNTHYESKDKTKPMALTATDAANIREAADVLLKEMKPAQRAKMVNEAIQFLNEVTALENGVRRFGQVTGGYERATIVEARQRKQLLRLHLSLEEKTQAAELYRPLFRQVEMGYMVIKNHTQTLARISRTEKSREKNKEQIEQLKTELQEAYRQFGEGYGEYKEIRLLLEVLGDRQASEGQELSRVEKSERSSARFILASIGIKPDLASRMGNVDSGSWVRPTLAEITDVFRQHPEVLIAKLKRDRKEERTLAVRVAVLSYPLFNFLKLLIFKLPPKIRGPVSTVLSLSYNTHLRDRYLDPIDRVVTVKDQPELQLDLLRELNSRSDVKDEMLVTFARLTFLNGDWVALRQVADAKGTDNAVYRDFAERMKKAEEQALKDGEMPLHYEATTAQKLLTVLSSTVTAATAYHFPEILATSADTLSTVGEVVRHALGM